MNFISVHDDNTLISALELLSVLDHLQHDDEEASVWQELFEAIILCILTQAFLWSFFVRESVQRNKHFRNLYKHSLEAAEFCENLLKQLTDNLNSLEIMLQQTHQQIVKWPGKVIIALCSLRALSSTGPGQLAQGQPRASPEPVWLAQRARGWPRANLTCSENLVLI